jgi:magnesium-transporting ATPase (P-type)
MVDFLIFKNEKEENFKIKSKQLRKENLNIMKKSEPPKKDRSEFIFALISIICGIIVLIILFFVFFVHPSEKAVGERFVLDELTFYTSIYQFHFKPITLLVIFSFLFLVFGAESLYSCLSKISYLKKRLFFIFFFLTTSVFTYETLQNFLLWTSFFILSNGNSLDEISHQVNPAINPVNYVFITKIFNFFLFSSLYGLYFFHRLMNPSDDYKNS